MKVRIKRIALLAPLIAGLGVALAACSGPGVASDVCDHLHTLNKQADSTVAESYQAAEAGTPDPEHATQINDLAKQIGALSGEHMDSAPQTYASALETYTQALETVNASENPSVKDFYALTDAKQKSEAAAMSALQYCE